MAPRPGVVALRPLRLGDVFDGAFKVMRRYPAAVIGSAALIATVASLAGVLAALLQQDMLGSGSVSPVGSILMVVAWLGSVVAVTLLSGIIVTPVERGMLGLTATFEESWRRALSRLGPLVLSTFLLSLGAALGVAVLTAPWILLGTVVDEAFYLVLLVMAPAGFVLALAAYARLLLAAPAIVVERAGPVAALRRSWELTRHRFWPILGTLLLACVVLYVISAVLQIPFTMLAVIVAAVGFDSSGSVGLPITYYLVTALGSILSSTVAYPFFSAVVSLLYFDQRIRKEGLDVELARQAGAR